MELVFFGAPKPWRITSNGIMEPMELDIARALMTTELGTADRCATYISKGSLVCYPAYIAEEVLEEAEFVILNPFSGDFIKLPVLSGPFFLAWNLVSKDACSDGLSFQLYVATDDEELRVKVWKYDSSAGSWKCCSSGSDVMHLSDKTVLSGLVNSPIVVFQAFGHSCPCFPYDMKRTQVDLKMLIYDEETNNWSRYSLPEPPHVEETHFVNGFIYGGRCFLAVVSGAKIMARTFSVMELADDGSHWKQLSRIEAWCGDEADRTEMYTSEFSITSCAGDVVIFDYEGWSSIVYNILENLWTTFETRDTEIYYRCLGGFTPAT